MKTVSEMLTALRAKLGQKKLQERISEEVVADPKALRMEAVRRLYTKEIEEQQKLGGFSHPVWLHHLGAPDECAYRGTISPPAVPVRHPAGGLCL